MPSLSAVEAIAEGAQEDALRSFNATSAGASLDNARCKGEPPDLIRGFRALEMGLQQRLDGLWRGSVGEGQVQRGHAVCVPSRSARGVARANQQLHHLAAVAPQVAAQCRESIPAASRSDTSRRFPSNSRATVSAGARSQMAPFKTDEPMHWTTSSCCRDDKVIAAVSKMPMATPGGPKPWQSASSSVVGGRAAILQASLNGCKRWVDAGLTSLARPSRHGARLSGPRTETRLEAPGTETRLRR